MRDFFKQILSNLYIYCGNRQVDKMTDEEIKILLDSLERMSKIYGYIPEEKQKEIILTCLVSDRDYQNINVRTVSRWFEQNGKTYFKEVAHKPTEPTAEPLKGEERDKWLELWKKELARLEQTFTPAEIKRAGQRMKEHFDEQGIKFDETKHKKYDPNDTSDLQEMLAEHEALNNPTAEGTTDVTEAKVDSTYTTQQENGVQEETLKTGDN